MRMCNVGSIYFRLLIAVFIFASTIFFLQMKILTLEDNQRKLGKYLGITYDTMYSILSYTCIFNLIRLFTPLVCPLSSILTLYSAVFFDTVFFSLCLKTFVNLLQLQLYSPNISSLLLTR